MSRLNKLERKYGKYSIEGLMKYIVIINFAVYLLQMINPTIRNSLALIPQLVFQGEVWRIITFVFIPPNQSIIFIFFALYFYYMIGTGLEQAWGSFKFNIYYLVGVLATVVFSLVTGVPVGEATYLNLSLFLAFAYLYPNFEVLLFFILPVKMKYLAYLDAFLLTYEFVFGNLSTKLMVLAAIINFLLFFGKDMINYTKNRKHVQTNRKKFKVIDINDYVRHKCTVCGITEKDNPDMEFRYCSKCNGHHEYCMKHLKDHKHIE